MTIKVKECRYCDGTLTCKPYGPEETTHCSSCGAEWDPIEVEYPDNHFDCDDLEDDLVDDDDEEDNYFDPEHDYEQ